MPKPPRQFSFGDVVRLSGVSARALDYWATSEFLSPSISEANGTGTKRVYSYADVVAARVAKYLRSAGLPFEALRELVSRFRMQQYIANIGPQGRLVIIGPQAIPVSNHKELVGALKTADDSYPACPIILPLGRILGDLKAELDRVPKSELESRVVRDRNRKEGIPNQQLDLFPDVNQRAKKPPASVKKNQSERQKVG